MDRYYFVGRSGGIINVGGLKVHPEEVEAVINSHPCVRMSLVRSRRNPITGAVVSGRRSDRADGHAGRAQATSDPPGDPPGLSRDAGLAQGAGAHPLRAVARDVAPRASWCARCVTFSSPAAAGASDSRSPRGSRRAAIAWSRSRAARPKSCAPRSIIAGSRNQDERERAALPRLRPGEIDAIGGLVAQLRREVGPLYGLVNNAGPRHRRAPLHDARSGHRGAGAPEHPVAASCSPNTSCAP